MTPDDHDDALLEMADCALRAFEESKHPRATDGKFGSGGGGEGGGSKPAPYSKESAARVVETHKALKEAVAAKKKLKWSLNGKKKKEASKAVVKAFNDHLNAVSTHKGWNLENDRSHAMNIERRSLLNASVPFQAIRVERRSEDVVVDGRPQRQEREWCVGYASVFGLLSLDLGDFVERIDQRAFDKVLARREANTVETRALWNHNSNYPLGRWPDTLRLIPDERGLRYEFPFGRTSYAQDLRMNIEDGIVRGSSFGFTVPPGGDRWSHEGGRSVRTVMEIDALYDVSPTTYPAYPDSDVAVAKRSFDQFLRAGGIKPPASQPRRSEALREYLKTHGREVG